MALPAVCISLDLYHLCLSIDNNPLKLRERRDVERGPGDVLDGFLAVEGEAEKRAQQTLYLRRRSGIDDSPLDILRAEMRAFRWEGVRKSRPEHDDEL